MYHEMLHLKHLGDGARGPALCAFARVPGRVSGSFPEFEQAKAFLKTLGSVID